MAQRAWCVCFRCPMPCIPTQRWRAFRPNIPRSVSSAHGGLPNHAPSSCAPSGAGRRGAELQAILGNRACRCRCYPARVGSVRQYPSGRPLKSGITPPHTVLMSRSPQERAGRPANLPGITASRRRRSPLLGCVRGRRSNCWIPTHPSRPTRRARYPLGPGSPWTLGRASGR